MSSKSETRTPIRFGVFELDVENHQLSKNGFRIRLQELPLRLLVMLLERGGDVVTREELQRMLWPGDQYGEFDIGLNTAVTKLRQALGDSAHSPRYIETIPRVGYRFIGQISQISEPPVSRSTATPAPEGGVHRYRIAAFAFGLALLAVSAVHFNESQPAPQEHPTRRFSFDAPGATSAVISPDGRYVAYVSETDRGSSIWLRSMVNEGAAEVAGTGGATGVFWAPDSASLGFAVAYPSYQLKRVSIDGIDLATLCPLPGDPEGALFAGGAWSRDGQRIVFSWRGHLFVVPALGGRPELLVDGFGPTHEVAMYPHFLPRDTHPDALIYASRIGNPLRWVVVTLNLESGDQQVVTEGSRPVYSPAGYIMYGSSAGSTEGVWAMPFSSNTLKATGEEFLLNASGAAPSFSNEGTVVYRDSSGPEMGMKTLVWRNRRGLVEETVGRPQPGLREFSLSPDRRSVAATVDEPCDIWVQDLTRSTVRKLTPDEGCEYLPTWSPSGEEIAYTKQGEGEIPGHIMRTSADGVGRTSVLIRTDRSTRYASWSRDGRYLVFQEQAEDRDSWNIRYIELDGGDGLELKTVLGSTADETAPMLSPDGRFMAYASDEAGRREVYIRPFPEGGRSQQVSANGGAQPRWGSDGAELFYVEDSETLMGVSFSADPEMVLGRPQRLFQSADFNFRRQPWPLYDVSADGQRILTATSVYTDVPATIRIVENWHQEYLRRSGSDAAHR